MVLKTVLLTSGAKGEMTWLVNGSANCSTSKMESCAQGMGVFVGFARCWSCSRGVSSSLDLRSTTVMVVTKS